MKRKDNSAVRDGRREIPCVGGLRLRAQEDSGESRGIEGTAIVFNSPSVPLYEDDKVVIREQIAPEAVSEELLNHSDILCTLYHDNTRILARAVNGAGTLTYERTEAGVSFSFDAPDTEDGRTALELVRRGEINGCSFAFGIDISDPASEERTVRTGADGRREVTYTVKKIARISDFTLTPRPAYRDTQVGTRLRDEDRAETAEEQCAGEKAAADLGRLQRLIEKRI